VRVPVLYGTKRVLKNWKIFKWRIEMTKRKTKKPEVEPVPTITIEVGEEASRYTTKGASGEMSETVANEALISLLRCGLNDLLEEGALKIKIKNESFATYFWVGALGGTWRARGGKIKTNGEGEWHNGV
jgi:hypothetical protein